MNIANSLTEKNKIHLGLFYAGVQAEVCIELSNQFGQITTSKVDLKLTKGALRDLYAKGLLNKKIVKHLGVEYMRYQISVRGENVMRKLDCEYCN